MNQSYFQKNLPAPVQFLVRPMLLISLGLHGLLLAIPMPSKQKPEAPKKEPEKVKITQLPTTRPSPKPSSRSSPIPTPKPTPQVRQTPRPQPTPIRQPSLVIPPVSPQTKSIPRPQPQPRPTPTPPKPTPTPTPPKPTPTPSPSPSPTIENPFADFPIYPKTQGGSLGLLSGETDQSARNTTDGLDQVAAFYKNELPARKFNAASLTEETNLKVYQVSKEGGKPQFLHLISKDGKTVIVLASEEIKDLNSLKDAEARSNEEIAFYDNVLKPLENDEKLILNAVESDDITKLPEAAKFADTNKFQPRVKTGKLAPKSPEELAAIYEAQLSQNGFTQISKEAPYGRALTYKVTQGKFKIYMYFVVNTDNNTLVILSKDSPF